LEEEGEEKSADLGVVVVIAVVAPLEDDDD